MKNKKKSSWKTKKAGNSKGKEQMCVYMCMRVRQKRVERSCIDISNSKCVPLHRNAYKNFFLLEKSCVVCFACHRTSGAHTHKIYKIKLNGFKFNLKISSHMNFVKTFTINIKTRAGGGFKAFFSYLFPREKAVPTTGYLFCILHLHRINLHSTWTILVLFFYAIQTMVVSATFYESKLFLSRLTSNK